MTDGNTSSLEWLQIIRGEYLEMPGLHLTPSQATRLWGLDEPACAFMLDVLVQENFLRVTTDGRYMLTSANVAPRRRRISGRAAGN